MPQNDDPQADEFVLRALIRRPRELSGPGARRHMDVDDFVRREKYWSTGLPENGLSLFRRSKVTDEEVYERFGIKRFVGIASCQWEVLTSKGLTHHVSGVKREHISLRCQECNRAGLNVGEVCKPRNSENHLDCPFFGPDLLDLNSLFKEIEAPALRAPRSKLS